MELRAALGKVLTPEREKAWQTWLASYCAR